MRCCLCNKIIRTKVTWKTLLSPIKKIICDDCFFRYPINITYSTFPLGTKTALWFSLFSETHNFNSLPFSFELGKLFTFVFEKTEGIYIYEEKIDYDKMDLYEEMTKFDEMVVFITLFA